MSSVVEKSKLLYVLIEILIYESTLKSVFGSRMVLRPANAEE